MFDLLDDAGLIYTNGQTPTDVLVLPMGDGVAYPLMIAKTLREAGIKTEVYFGDVKFKNKMVYANKTGVPYVVILGEDEEKSQVVSFKNMTTGEQETVPLSEVAKRLNDCLSARPVSPVITQV